MNERIRMAKQCLETARKLLEAAEGDKCGKQGCIRQVDGKWRVMSGKTGKLWPAKYPTKQGAEDALDAWHASRFKGAK